MAITHPTVRKLKEIIDSKGLAEGEEFLRSVWKAEDTSLMIPLILMREYRADTKYLDEMWVVIHAVEGYPMEAFIDHLVTNIDLISERSPYLLNHLLHRLKNNTEYLEYFSNELSMHKPVRIDRLMTILEKMKQESVKFPVKVAAVDRIIRALQEH